MAVSTLTFDPVSGVVIHVNTDVDESEDDVDSGSGVLYGLEIDNSNNGAVTFIHLYNAASGAVTVGTTEPDFRFQVPASVKRTVMIPDGMAYDTALSIAATTTAGGNTGPSSAVTVKLLYG